MIARHTLQASLLFASIALVPAIPATAVAGELMPWESPENINWQDINLDQKPPAVPAPDTAAGTDKSKDTGPNWQAPVVDAYFDVSTTLMNFDKFDYPKMTSGYRFGVGFRLGALSPGRWSFAPEIGYARTGQQTRVTSSVSHLDPSYDVIQTDTSSLDISALNFGARLAYRVVPALEVFARGGTVFYHLSDKLRTRFEYIEKNSNPPKDPTSLTPSSSTTAGANLFGTVGIAIPLGKVPSIYVEYGSERIAGKSMPFGAAGFLLNF